MLIGNIGGTPKITVSQNSGRKRCEISLATSKHWKNKDGEKMELVQWHKCTCWGNTAAAIEQMNLAKGTALYIEGEILYGEYRNKEGVTVHTTEIAIDVFQILTPKNAQKTSSRGNSNEQNDFSYVNDDVPF